MDNMDFTLDFMIDLYKVLEINEKVLYQTVNIANDKYYKIKIASIINKYLNLPEYYMTVNNGIVVEKTSLLLHKEILKIIAKSQKKHYKNLDMLGVNSKTNILTSFYEGCDYICDMYTTNRHIHHNYINWIKNYNEDLVYFETDTYKIYGSSSFPYQKTVNYLR